MASKLFLDIETLPCPPELRGTWESTLKRPTVGGTPILPGLSDLQNDRFSKTGLQGEWGRVLCIGVAENDDDPLSFYEDDERKLLSAFWRFVECSAHPLTYVGYNIRQFDLPFLAKRSIIHGVPCPHIKLAKYKTNPVFDVMEVWANWEWRSTVTLDTLAKALGLPSSKTGMSGSDVERAYLEGRLQDILAYCLRDVNLVRAIYKRMVFERTEPRQLSLTRKTEVP